MGLVNHLDNCVAATDNATARYLALDGMSGPRFRHLLNRVCSIHEATYLEVGLYKGSTFFSALDGNSLNAYGVDNWSEFGGPVDIFRKRLPEYAGHNTVTIYDGDIFSMDLSTIKTPIDIYFYDGNHEEESQAKALTYTINACADEFIFMVDDYNWPKVHLGTQRGIKEAGLTILREYHFGANENANAQGCALAGSPAVTPVWWNGMYVSVLKKA